MAKRVFAIVLNEPNQTFSESLKLRFPDSYKYSPTFFLVRPALPMLSKDVAKTAALKAQGYDNRPSGVVYKLNAGYWGYASKTLWEWLDASDD